MTQSLNFTQVHPINTAERIVFTTHDYSVFKSIQGNRNKNLMHINRLTKSMKGDYIFTNIVVNEKYEIIDGQHRFDVINALSLPLHYIICEGYGLKEVHILNTNSKTWSSNDYLLAYCNEAYIDYLQYKIFKDKYKLGHSTCMQILGGPTYTTGLDPDKLFNKGSFKIINYKASCDFADKLEIIGEFYHGYKRRSFTNAMCLLLKNKDFIFSEFIQKLKLQPTSLTDCIKHSQYLDLIEKIYNYHRKEKVNLRY